MRDSLSIIADSVIVDEPISPGLSRGRAISLDRDDLSPDQPLKRRSTYEMGSNDES